MQQNEMWLDVLAWMGWTNIRPNTAPHNEYKGLIGTKDCRNLPIPELTLDELHECENKLRPELANKYADELTRITSFGSNPHWTHWFHLLHSKKEKRLLALWRTIRNSSTRTTPESSETSQ